MAQIKLNIIQIVHMPHYEKLLIEIVNMAHICDVMYLWHDPNKRHVPNSSHVASIKHGRVLGQPNFLADFPDTFFGIPGVCMSGPEQDFEQGGRFLLRRERFIKFFIKRFIWKKNCKKNCILYIPHALFIFCPHLGQNYHTWHRGIVVEHILMGI